MNKTYLRGECVEIDTVDSGLCIGTVFSQNQDKTRIALFNVKCLADTSILKGYTYYDSSEIKSIHRVSRKLGTFILNQTEYDNLQFAAKTYIFVGKIDSIYQLAIDDLKKSSYIGVGSDGTEMGRRSELGILTLTTPKQIYIFDIHVLRESAFSEGIKSLLECSLCMKIIHDSRNLSDLLFHKYNVVLKHVFDTAVADVVIMKNKRNYFPKELKTLPECLLSYMGLSNVVDNLKSTEYANDTECLHIQKIAAMNNTYLHYLKDIMKNKMTASLERGFECYMNIERRNDDFEAWNMKSDDMFPKALLEEL